MLDSDAARLGGLFSTVTHIRETLDDIKTTIRDIKEYISVTVDGLRARVEAVEKTTSLAIASQEEEEKRRQSFLESHERHVNKKLTLMGIVLVGLQVVVEGIRLYRGH
jgi:hypothetical protein